MAAQTQADVATSRIAPDCRLEGELVFSGPVHLSGHILGSLTCEGCLTVEAGASIEGRVRAADIIVRGSVKGDIAASRLIEVHTGGQIDGVIFAPSITAASGTRIDGDVMIAPERPETHIRRADEAMALLTARRRQPSKAEPRAASPAPSQPPGG
ncbi:MAG: polymer-forming cytoskeletal protein [Hyphomonas sp.]